MRDIGYHALGYRFMSIGGNSDDDDDDDECPSSEDGAVPTVEGHVVSATVGLPARIGQPVCSDKEPESSPVTDLTLDLGISSQPPVKSSLREILKKVAVNEAVLRNAIESLGGGVKGLQAVVDYVKHFQETRGVEAGNVNSDDFTRGLEQFFLLHDQAKSGSQNQSVDPAVPSTNDSETHQGSGAYMSHNQQILPNVQIQGQDEWSRSGHAGEPYTMGYMQSMRGYFPNFCYLYPPPFASYGQFNMGVQPMYMPMMQVPYFTPPSFKYVQKSDATTTPSRKNRIDRRRGDETDPHHARRTIRTADAGGGTAQSGNQENMAHQKLAVSSSGQIAEGDLRLILQKELSPSGVSSLGRIVLPKKECETHLPQLVASEGVLLTMTDFDTAQSWTFRYRFWSNNKSRMYLLENTREFVKAHNLQERDMLSLYRDAEGNYVVRGEKHSSSQTGDAANAIAAEEDVPTKRDLPRKKQKL